MVLHQPMRKTMRAISMMILSRPTMAPAVRDVNQSFEASFSMEVTSSTPAFSIVASTSAGSEVPVRATSACAWRFWYMVSRT